VGFTTDHTLENFPDWEDPDGEKDLKTREEFHLPGGDFVEARERVTTTASGRQCWGKRKGKKRGNLD